MNGLSDLEILVKGTGAGSCELPKSWSATVLVRAVRMPVQQSLIYFAEKLVNSLTLDFC